MIELLLDSLRAAGIPALIILALIACVALTYAGVLTGRFFAGSHAKFERLREGIEGLTAELRASNAEMKRGLEAHNREIAEHNVRIAILEARQGGRRSTDRVEPRDGREL